MAKCEHKSFEAKFEVNRFEDGRFQADIGLRCVDCKLPFKFLGLPMGLDFSGAAVSYDGCEARMAVWPSDLPIPGIEDQPAGFRIFNHSDERADDGE